MSWDEREPPALPFAAVMATGVASELARPAGLAALTLPLLAWAGLQAAWIALAGLRHRRAAGERWFGALTIPIGCAVLGSGLAGQKGAAWHDGAAGLEALAGVTGIVLLCSVVRNAVDALGRQGGESAVDGTWFLAPATCLALAAGGAAVAPAGPGAAGVVSAWVLAGLCALGAAAYLLVLVLAAGRVRRCGLGSTRASWWIAAGCGGLAAAAIGRSATEIDRLGRVAAQVVPVAGACACGVASFVLVPVLVASAASLARTRALGGAAPWPPTFSSGVYALGAIQAGRLGNVAALGRVGDIAGIATVLLWAVTTGLGAVARVRDATRPAPAG